MQFNWAYRLGCVNIAAAIITGAAGGHKPWPQEQKNALNQAVLYHLMSGVGMIVASQPLSWIPVVLLQSSVIFFSCALYHRSFTNDKKISSKVAPLGGMSMIIGWLLLAIRRV